MTQFDRETRTELLTRLVRDGRAPARIGILETEDGLGIYNPARRAWLMVAFLCVWLVGWGIGETFAIGSLLTSPLPAMLFLAVWLSFWTIGGLTVLAVVAWQIAGAELIFLTGDTLVREFRVFGLSYRQILPLARLTDFRIDPVMRRNALFAGHVLFEDNGRKRSLGIGMDDVDATLSIRAIETYRRKHGVGTPPQPTAGKGEGPAEAKRAT